MKKEISLKNTIGEETLREIQDSYFKYLESSTAIYEADGGYASVLVSSKYCDFLNRTSRQTAGETEEQALKSGKWICHEDCWFASRESIKREKTCEFECSGGINICAEPIIAEGKIIGSINAGISNPPVDRQKIEKIAGKYKIAPEKLLKMAEEYVPRPDYVLKAARESISIAAKTIAGYYLLKTLTKKVEYQNNFLNTILSSLPYPFYVIDAKNYTVKMANAAAGFGQLSEKSKCYMLTHKRNTPCSNEHICPLEEVKKTRKKVVTEHIHYDSKGNPEYVEVYGYPVFDVHENLVKMIEYSFNITERKKTSETLVKLSRAVKESPSILMITDKNGTVEYVNPKFTEITGYSEKEIIGRNASLLQGQSREDTNQMWKLITKGKEWKGEFYNKKKNGEYYWESALISSIKDSKGIITHYIKVAEDVTIHKQIEEKIKKSYKSLHNLVMKSDIAMIVTDLKGTVIFTNPQAETLLNKPSGKLIGGLFGVVTKENTVVEIDIMHNGKPGGIAEVNIIATEWEGNPAKLVMLHDVTMRKEAEKKVQNTLEKLRKAFGGIIQVILTMVEVKDPYTAGHQQRVSNLARAIADELGLDKSHVDAVRVAGLIHDLGKISLPSEILTRPGKLNDIEFQLIQTHSQAGYDILKKIEFPWPIAEIVYQHHERMNGSGYPRGIKGDAIRIEAHILAVADVVEAMSSHRPYRASLGIDIALQEILKNKGILYHRDVVDACLKLFKEKNFQL
ncbi:MAG: HD domain-containing phosphohydrolase [bacterium]